MTSEYFLTVVIGCVIGGTVAYFVPDNWKYPWGFFVGMLLQNILQFI